MTPSYTDALSLEAEQHLRAQYGTNGKRYGGIASWRTIARGSLHFITYRDFTQALYASHHPAQLHYGIWDLPSIHSFDAAIRRSSQLAYKGLNLTPSNKSRSIFHAGCGWGGVDIQLCQLNPHLHTVGVSIDPSQIEIAIKLTKLYNISSRAIFEKQNFLSLPAKWNHYFDGGIAMESFCHIPATQLSLLWQQHSRILKSKSRFVVHDWFLKRPPQGNAERHLFEDFLKGWDLPGSVSAKDMSDTAQNAGLREISRHDYTKYILKSADKNRFRAIIFAPIVKLSQMLPNSLSNTLGFTSSDALDFIQTCKTQKYLFANGILEYLQYVFEKP